VTVLGRTTATTKALAPERTLRLELLETYRHFGRKWTDGETEALTLALRYSLERCGECGHGRETVRDDKAIGLICPCGPAEYLSVPRWLLIAAESVAAESLKHATKGRGQHAKVLTRFRDELRDAETFRLVEIMRRAGKTLNQACASGRQPERDRTIRAAHARVARNPSRYLRALEWQAAFPYAERESHFTRNRAAAIERLFASPLDTIEDFSARIDKFPAGKRRLLPR